MKNIAILGSTGSIGTQTLEVIEAHSDKFQVVALSAGDNISLFLNQIRKFTPEIVSVKNKESMEIVKREFPNLRVYSGEDGLIEVATYQKVDFVVSAVVGSIGLKPTIKAIEAGKTIGLANKETLVSAGHIVMNLGIKYNVPIIPIDSEHSAIFQSLNGESIDNVKRIILTASGGSFRNKSREELQNVTVEQALKHPNWSMGAKITIDSATMMNKGLEIIEAHWLFNLPFEKIDVLIHPESIIHSMVEYNDKAVIAQLGTPDMKVPIQYAISYPTRIELESESLNLAKIGSLNFFEPDFSRFPSLRIAYQAGKEGGTMPTVLNAANEVVVDAFLQGRIPFIEIESFVESTLGHHIKIVQPTLEEILEADKWARDKTREIIKREGW